jgi:4-alpha-glucanotransferase
MRCELRSEIGKEKFLQYIFSQQWNELRRYCSERGIRIIGDLPLYVNYDSADVWTHPELFKLDAWNQPIAVAGVPPDYFSKTGQLWKNPLYRWEEHERTGFSWWLDRLRHNFSLVDFVRIDHFRGLVSYWEVPAGAKTAIQGRWVPAPAEKFLTIAKKQFPQFPVIAEDLGVITKDVNTIMQKFDLPGMRVLIFAFTGELSKNPHALHNLSKNIVLYTGTHDNPPVRGWFELDATEQDRTRLFRYLGRECTPDELPGIFIRLAMMSVANTVIIPIQDILGSSESRMNTPGTDRGNWKWRMREDRITAGIVENLREMTEIFGRAPGDPLSQ